MTPIKKVDSPPDHCFADQSTDTQLEMGKAHQGQTYPVNVFDLLQPRLAVIYWVRWREVEEEAQSKTNCGL